uniref:Uncharacterized protein n=1 Tax=Anopheles minimus TaxID=112268 RepID=A0A182WBF0_9DIPT
MYALRHMANLMTVRLQRGDGQAWGFRLQGGKDFSAPLVLQRHGWKKTVQPLGVLFFGCSLVLVGLKCTEHGTGLIWTGN